MLDNKTKSDRGRPYLPLRSVKNDNSIYLPLDPSSMDIRYLRLHAGPVDQPIECSLGYTTLDTASADHVPYIAVSYCWGQIKDTVEIVLSCPTGDGLYNSHQFRVTRNLHAALLALRFPDKDRDLWVDAVCISQDDPKEKTHQVGLLSLIFSSAKEVVVWLGEEDESSRIIISFQAHAQVAYNRSKWSSTIDAFERMDAVSLEELWLDFLSLACEDEVLLEELEVDELSEASLCEGLYKSIDNIVSRPWFRRIWVFQEVLLSPRTFSNKTPRTFKTEMSVTMLLGSLTMTWQAWARLTRLSFKSPCVQRYERRNLTWFNGAWYKATMLGGHANYAYYFDRTRKFLSTDPRDKLFALLHIASDTRGWVGSHPDFRPNYEKSLNTIVLDLARHGIVVPMLLRTTLFFDAYKGNNWVGMVDFDFELLYPADPYASFEYYDTDPSPFASQEGTILPYRGTAVTRIARKLNLHLGRTWCKQKRLFKLHRANRIDWLLNELLRVCRPVVPSEDEPLIKKNILNMVVGHYPGDPDLFSRSVNASTFERTWFWVLACTGSWTPHNGYGAPQLFITVDNRLVLGSNEIEPGDFVATMPGGDLNFMMAVDRRQKNAQTGDYKFAGACSFYADRLSPATVTGLDVSYDYCVSEDYCDNEAFLDAGVRSIDPDRRPVPAIEEYHDGDSPPYAWEEFDEAHDDPMFEDYLDSEEHLSTLQSYHRSLGLEASGTDTASSSTSPPKSRKSSIAVRKSRIQSLKAAFTRQRS